MNRILTGALAGALATIPMSWAMEVMHRLLPAEQQHPLPPRLITDRLLEKADVKQKLNERQRVWLSLINHLAYGAAMGAIYESFSERVPLRPMKKGVLYGCLVWAASYLGGLPGMGLVKPATQHPARRNALMIVAHFVYGSGLAVFHDLFQPPQNRDHPGFLSERKGPGALIRRVTEKYHG